MHQEQVIAQVILCSAGDVRRYHELRQRGVIPDQRHWAIFVLGRYSAEQLAKPADRLPFVEAWGAAPAPWAVCAFGRHEAACATAALPLSGQARVGFENNLCLPDGSRAAGNQDLVAGIARVAGRLGYSLADADAIRGWFG
jgi:3-keto-5-aminohexanoate cleavage enzyme